MATETEPQPSEQELAEAIELVERAIERASVFAARGAPVPERVAAWAHGLAQSALTLLALALEATPRELAESAFKAALSDDDWCGLLEVIRGDPPSASGAG